MKRRQFLGLLGGAAAWPLAARAERPEIFRRVGLLMPVADDDADARLSLRTFRQTLLTQGWKENSNIRIEIRWAAANPAKLRQFASELAQLNPDVAFVIGGPALAALRRETSSSQSRSVRFPIQLEVASSKV